MTEDTLKTILIIEDDPVLKNLLDVTFTGKYHTMYAGNGGDALKYLEGNTPDVILLDLMLPEMSGFEVLEKIRNGREEIKNIPVIIVSNLGQESDREKALSLGANDYMVKAEVAIEEITEKIESLTQ